MAAASGRTAGARRTGHVTDPAFAATAAVGRERSRPRSCRRDAHLATMIFYFFPGSVRISEQTGHH
jgi:hypothetical protein